MITARAKGLPEYKVVLKYPVRIALNPFVSAIGWVLPELVSGVTITAIVLNLPTAGPLLLRALIVQDMYLAGSFILLLGVLTLIGMLVSDLLLALLDPAHPVHLMTAHTYHRGRRPRPAPADHAAEAGRRHGVDRRRPGQWTADLAEVRAPQGGAGRRARSSCCSISSGSSPSSWRPTLPDASQAAIHLCPAAGASRFFVTDAGWQTALPAACQRLLA